jgi:tetratricopeptide (TPR) repeat protein
MLSQRTGEHFPSMTDRMTFQHRWFLAVILILTAGLYIQLLHHELVWDEHTLTAQLFVTSPTWKHYRQSFQQTHRPLALLSVALDRFIWRGWPPGYAVDSLIYHGLVIVLFFHLCRRWLSIFPTVAATLIVALHPIGTETVLYLLGRPDLLSVMWSLAALLLFSRTPPSDRPLRLAAAFYGCGLLAFAAKETAVLLPFLALVIISTRTGTGTHTFRRVRQRILFIPLFILIFVVLLGRIIGWEPVSQHHWNWAAGADGVALMAAVTMKSLQLVAWPVDLFPWYEGLIHPPSAAVTAAGLYLIGLALAIGGVWTLRVRAPAMSLGIAWLTGILLLIALRVNTAPPPMNPLSIRWLYPAVIGAALIIGGILQWLEPQWPRASRVATACGVGLLALLTWQTQPVWQNDLTLFQRAVEGNPQSVFLTLQYIDVLNTAGRRDQADRLFAQLLAQQPDHPRVVSRLVRLAIDRGDFVDAIRQSRALMRLAPSPLTARTLGDLLAMTDQPTAAIEAYHTALAGNPRDMMTITSLGTLYERHQRWEEAIALYRAGVETQPAASNLWFRYGRTLEQAGRLQEAAGAFERVMQLDRDCPDGYLAGARVERALNHPASAEERVARYTRFAHRAPIPRPTGDPLDSPCGGEPKLIYKRMP